ncbi:MAG: hypothetical protein LKE68_08850 [Prevotella sp.]|jgi:hypothetical protein|nr:hypothetical protein [Prevotella sp.]MCH3992683.1 hypothetical protein [Prevotella sp.]
MTVTFCIVLQPSYHRTTDIISVKVVFTIRYRWNTTGKRYKGTGAGNDEKSRL